MDRKVLIVFIAIMSALVVLLMVHFNQQVIAPTPEPTTLAQDNGIVKPLFTDMTNVTLKNTTSTENATVIPTIILVQPTVNRPAPTRQPISTTPMATPTYTPTPWGPVPPASPMPHASPLSWDSGPLFVKPT